MSERKQLNVEIKKGLLLNWQIICIKMGWSLRERIETLIKKDIEEFK